MEIRDHGRPPATATGSAPVPRRRTQSLYCREMVPISFPAAGETVADLDGRIPHLEAALL
jgi:hypothetical protein